MDDSTDPYRPGRYARFSRNYWDLVGGMVFAFFAFTFHMQGSVHLGTLFAAISVSMLSVTVAEIAEIVAEKLGEPYGSYMLTFSAVIVEIILLFMIILQAGGTGAYAREAMETVKGGIISAVLVDMNVLLGLAVFVGGLTFKEQEHNEDTSNSYTTILLVTAAILLVPGVLKYTDHGPDAIRTASYLIGGLLMLFYVIILVFQTRTHIHFFKSTARSRIFRYRKKREEENDGGSDDEENKYIFDRMTNWENFAVIFLLIAVIGFMAEIFASDGLKLVSEYGIPTGLAGIAIAIVAVAPELFTAVKAAKNDQIQRVVNIAMGASTVSILLTVPILLALSWSAGITLTLDFNPLQVGALMLTVILAWKTTQDGETNYLEGMAHLVFFLAYAIIAGLY